MAKSTIDGDFDALLGVYASERKELNKRGLYLDYISNLPVDTLEEQEESKFKAWNIITTYASKCKNCIEELLEKFKGESSLAREELKWFCGLKYGAHEELEWFRGLKYSNNLVYCTECQKLEYTQTRLAPGGVVQQKVGYIERKYKYTEEDMMKEREEIYGKDAWLGC